ISDAIADWIQRGPRRPKRKCVNGLTKVACQFRAIRRSKRVRSPLIRRRVPKRVLRRSLSFQLYCRGPAGWGARVAGDIDGEVGQCFSIVTAITARNDGIISEAVVTHPYVAVLIARLVSLYSSPKSDES